MSIIKKIITKSNSLQLKTKTKQFNPYFIRKSMSPRCDWLTGWKKEQIGAKFRNTFPFLKTFNFTVINVIRYQLKSLKCSFIFT